MESLQSDRTSIYRFGDFELHPHTRRLLRGGRPAAIQPKPFDVLLFLIVHRGQVVTRDRLLAEVWPEVRVNPQALGFALHAVRKAVDDDGERQAVIRTVPRAGLQFVAPVEEVTFPVGIPTSADSRAADPRSLFLGRDRLIERTRGLLEDVMRGKGALLLVAGGPGLGKSRVLQELADIARATGCAAVQGHCSEIGGAPPYWPWAQALRELRHALPTAVDPELWEEVLPLRSRRGSSGLTREGSAARFRWFDTIGEVLRRTTRLRPCVILLDDVHRADLPSLRLLSYLTEELGSLGVILVAAHREFELLEDPERSAVFTRLTRALGTQTLRLEGLRWEEVAELARSVVDADADFARRLHEHTAGNPFFVMQLLALVAPGGAAREMELPRELPPTVRAAVVRHLDALPRETRRLLAIAAVLGREFDVDLLVRTSETPESSALAQLARAAAAGALIAPRRSGGLYRFRHILVRDALYEQWPDDERACWHLRAAEALRERHGAGPGGRSAELAAHFLEAVPIGAVAEAIRHAIAAGRWAREQLAFEEAAAQLERALALCDRHGVLSSAEQCDLRVELGAAHNACGNRSTARRALDEAAATARRLGDGRRLARAALGASPGLFAIETGVEDRPLIAMLEAALSLCPASETALRAQLLCRLAMAVYWSADAPRRFELADQACALAREVGEPRITAYASLTRFAAYWSADNLDQRAKEADPLVERAEASGDLELELMARVFRISTLLDRGDVARYAAEVRSLRRIIDAGRYPQASWYPILYEATLALLHGRMAELEDRVREFAAVGERFGDLNALASVAAYRTLLVWLRGHVSDAVNLGRLSVNSSHAVPAHRCSLALWAARAGCRDEALREVRQLFAGGLAAIPRDMLWLPSVTFLAEAIAVVGDREHARACYELLRPYRGRYSTIGYGAVMWGPVDRALGLLATLLGDYDQAETHLRRALAMCDRIGARAISVNTRLNWAQLLDARRGPGDAARKRQIAEGILREACELGLAFYTLEIERILDTPRS